MTHYIIGISVLSNSDTGAKAKKFAGAEATRILSLLEGQFEESDIAKEALGRPFFPNRAVDFNIAHSGALLAISFARGKNLRVGCDVERMRSRAGAAEIAKRFFCPPETNYIFPQGAFNEARFYEIWTLKECFLKLRGLSVFDMANSPSFISDEDPCTAQFAFGAIASSAATFRLYELLDGTGERYMLASAIEGAVETQPEIRWFSQVPFDCRMIAEIKAAPNPAETVSPKR